MKSKLTIPLSLTLRKKLHSSCELIFFRRTVATKKNYFYSISMNTLIDHYPRRGSSLSRNKKLVTGKSGAPSLKEIAETMDDFPSPSSPSYPKGDVTSIARGSASVDTFVHRRRVPVDVRVFVQRAPRYDMISALTPLAFFSSARSSSGWRLPGMRFYRFVDPCPDVPCICMSTTTHDRVQSIDREAYRWDRASLFFECSPPARGEHRETSEPANNKTRPFRHLLHPAPVFDTLLPRS